MLLRQKLSIFIVISTILAAGVVYMLSITFIQQVFDDLLNEQKQVIIDNVTKDISIFDQALESVERKWNKDLSVLLPQAAYEYVQEIKKNPAIDQQNLLQDLRQKYLFSDLHVVDENLRVSGSTEPEEVGLDLTKFSKEYTEYLLNLMNKEQFSTKRISLSDITGRLKKYAYFSPLNSNILLNADIDVINRLARDENDSLANYIFGEYVSQLELKYKVVDKIDLLLITESNEWSFFKAGRRADSNIAQQLYTSGLTEKTDGNTYYSKVNFIAYDELGFKAFLKVSFNTSFEQNLRKTLQVIIAAICLFFCVLLLIVLHVGIRSVFLNRLEQLIAKINNKEIGDGTTMKISGNDELTFVSEAIDRNIRRIEKQLEINEDLKLISMIDSLTNLANRRALDEKLDVLWRQAQRTNADFSVMMIDVDFFKEYNDYYGHIAGDECLVAIARALSKSLNRPSDFIARYGGEEFFCILPDTNIDGAKLLAKSICKEIEQLQIAHHSSAVSNYVTVSIGCLTIHGSQKSMAEMIINSVDNLLYDAKRGGRNKVIAQQGFY